MAFNPQFQFGEGLSYTTFAYSDLRPEANDFREFVTGECHGKKHRHSRGKDAVLVYVSDLVASISPPGKRLRRFAKINLDPGQSKPDFKLRREDLSFIGSDNKPILEPGEFEVRIGNLRRSSTLK